ncbi:MAG: lysophospholipid acyltransferase family protein [Pseudomonadota bacterium]
MLRRFCNGLVRVITTTFFRRIDVVGAENIPAEGPVIFAGNHPNALMDGWLIAARCGRWPLHFMVNAKLWKFKGLGTLLDASGAVPVYPRAEHGSDADNSKAFEKLYEVIEAGHCMGVFPEGVSHTESHLMDLKTGTARIALTVADRGKRYATVVPCGLNYIHRHRFRSQVMLEFGEPIVVDETWAEKYRADPEATVRELTEVLADSLRAVTINAPDWNTWRFAQTSRRLYKPASASLTPAQYVDLNRRFIDGYAVDDPDVAAFRVDAENYQARLDMLGLKDYQLRSDMSLTDISRKVFFRTLWMLALLPIAIPGAILHLPVGWIAAAVGERFSYEMDDVATLKVFSTMLLLPLVYLGTALLIGLLFGTPWGIAALILLVVSFFSSLRVIEAQASLLASVASLMRLARLREEISELRTVRGQLVARIRALVDRLADPSMERMFVASDFASTDEPGSQS